MKLKNEQGAIGVVLQLLYSLGITSITFSAGIEVEDNTSYSYVMIDLTDEVADKVFNMCPGWIQQHYIIN